MCGPIARLRLRRSSSIVWRGGRGITGTYFLRNFLFRSVIRPEPSTLTTYWSNWRTSTTEPVLSHLLGWIRTQSPTNRAGRRFVCSDQYSAARICQFLSASSRAERVSRQVSCGLYRPGSMGMKSLTGRPNTHEAGDSFVSGSGVFRYWRIAR